MSSGAPPALPRAAAEVVDRASRSVPRSKTAGGTIEASGEAKSCIRVDPVEFDVLAKEGGCGWCGVLSLDSITNELHYVNLFKVGSCS